MVLDATVNVWVTHGLVDFDFSFQLLEAIGYDHHQSFRFFIDKRL